MQMPGRLALISAAAILATLSGCYGVARTVTGGMPHVWVGSGATDAFMVQLTRQGNTLSGTLDDTSLNSPGATASTPLHAAFTGTIDGSAMTLTFPAGLGFNTSISGTLHGNVMTLQAPQDDGSIAKLTLKPSSVDDYNQLVTKVRSAASANAAASQAAAADAARAADHQRTRQQIDDAATTVARDVTSLHNAVNQGVGFSSFEHDLATAKNDLATAQADAAKAATESDQPSACSDAYSAQSDAYSVQSDAYSIDSDMFSANSDIDAVNSAITALKQDLTTYQQTAAIQPTYTPPNPPDNTAIQTLINDANATAGEWKTKGSGYQSQVAQLVTKANTVAGQAVKRYC